MGRAFRGWALSVITLAAGPAAFSQEAPNVEHAKLLTVEAALNLRSVSELQFSPDGARLAFTVTEPAKGTGRLKHIWIYEQQGDVVRQFTSSLKSESLPRWSPDGKQLAFLSNRDEDQQQIFLMRENGGEGRAVAKGKRSVKTFEWSPDGAYIAFLAPDAKTEEEEKKEKDKDDAKVVDKDDKHAQLWILDVASGETRALTKANWNFDELAWLPAGDRVAVKGTEHPESDEYTERIYSVQVADATMKELVAPRGPFGEMRVAPNGKTISYVGAREDGPEPHDLMLLPITAHAARNLTGANLDRPVEDYHWQKDGPVVLLAANGFSNLLVSYSTDGARHDLAPSPMAAGSLALAANGDIAFVSQTATQPHEIWLWDQKGAARQLSHLNDSWKQYALSEPELYKYKSFDGTEIEAALLKPRGVG